MPKALQQDLPVWNLCDLYDGVDDPNLQKDLDQQLEAAAAFTQAYQHTIATGALSAAHFKAALDDYEALSRNAMKPLAFAQLLFSTNTQDPKHGALLQRVREAASSINTHLVFFELEIGKIPQAVFDALIGDAALKDYAHYLTTTHNKASHHLSEPEEKILVETSNARGPAFVRLFSEIQSRTTYDVRRDGELHVLTQSDVLALLYDADRQVRAQAAEALSEGLRENAHAVTFIYNTLIHEKHVLDRLRGFALPESERHLDNEIDQQAVDTMTEVCVANFDVVGEYYDLKRTLLGLDELTHYDRYAPVGNASKKFSFPEAKQLVLEAFSDFDPRLGQMAEPFFSQRWIHAAIVEGKNSGAFCAGVTPDVHPYVFVNYTHTINDVMTLAHELGHGVHDVLAAHNHMLDYQPALPLAETASTFGEMLVFDHLLSQLDDDRDKLQLLCGKIENLFATVFRQVGIFRFERRAHQLRREQGELPTEAYNELWQETQQDMFGASLKLGQDHACWWLYIPHIIQLPFYVYAYAFGELLVLSLYARYREEGAGFIDNYFKLLAAGGSKSPAQLVTEMGFDIADAAFWQAGCNLIRQRLEQAKALL